MRVPVPTATVIAAGASPARSRRSTPSRMPPASGVVQTGAGQDGERADGLLLRKRREGRRLHEAGLVEIRGRNRRQLQVRGGLHQRPHPGKVGPQPLPPLPGGPRDQQNPDPIPVPARHQPRHLSQKLRQPGTGLRVIDHQQRMATQLTHPPKLPPLLPGKHRRVDLPPPPPHFLTQFQGQPGLPHPTPTGKQKNRIRRPRPTPIHQASQFLSPPNKRNNPPLRPEQRRMRFINKRGLTPLGNSRPPPHQSSRVPLLPSPDQPPRRDHLTHEGPNRPRRDNPHHPNDQFRQSPRKLNQHRPGRNNPRNPHQDDIEPPPHLPLITHTGSITDPHPEYAENGKPTQSSHLTQPDSRNPTHATRLTQPDSRKPTHASRLTQADSRKPTHATRLTQAHPFGDRET